MATKSSTLNRKSTGFRLNWWMTLVLVGIVAVVGILVIRLSHAATFTGTPELAGWQDGRSATPCNAYGPTGTKSRFGDYTCATLSFPSGFRPVVTPFFVASSGIVIWKMKDAANTECGTVSERNPAALKNGSNPGYITGRLPGDFPSTMSTTPIGNTVYWTRTNCSID